MSEFRVVSHVVNAQRIEKFAPLITGGDKLCSPDQGIVLILENEKRVRWMVDTGVPMPRVNDWLVSDQDLHVTYVIPAQKFGELFTAVDSK